MILGMIHVSDFLKLIRSPPTQNNYFLPVISVSDFVVNYYKLQPTPFLKNWKRFKLSIPTNVRRM
jgi:hypothetical protein